ncbi:MAG: YdcF family protein [Candidatus Omnitrophica bacterium]|nr:YdcF family protein [Candidatus Omnitrophota bacterium]
MLKHENIICISSIDWDFIWQSHQQVMSAFAKNNNRVLFIENTGVRGVGFRDAPRLKKRFINWVKSVKGYRKVADNLYVYSPLILPFPYSRIALWVNKFLLMRSLKRWMRAAEFNNPIIWTYLPTPIVLSLINEIPHKLLVYYIGDNMPATSKGARKSVKYEQALLRKADQVFVMPKDLLEYSLRFNQHVIRIPMGVDVNKFLNCPNLEKTPDDLTGIRKPVIGYIGGFRNSVDEQLIAFLAERFADQTFVFVGPIQTDISKLAKFKNLIFVGQKPHEELPRYINMFEVGIIAYKKDSYGDNISSGKLNEYLIMGKPVISTRLKEIENFNKDNDGIVYIADDYEEFARMISKAIKEDNGDLRKKRVEVACKNSWDNKIKQMSEALRQAIKRKENTEVFWQDKLLSMYALAKSNFFRLITPLVIAWLLLFYTPLVWYIGKPLIVSEQPQKADCIIAFAGGVGESGEAGQGYEERVYYAVELSKKRYAKNLIFSSGYTYVFKEPVMMKSLATSLGVPASAITLEDKATNTYENVLFSEKILLSKGWNSALLVSSPYHMRRSFLVVKKLANNINITFTPVPFSRFYAKGVEPHGAFGLRQITFHQIRGIFHEYLAIISYWLKGYI